MKKKLMVLITILVLLASCEMHLCEKDEGTRIEPTCTTAGSVVYRCKECGKIMQTVYLSALGHDSDSGTRIEPTCKEAGSITYKCLRCGKVISVHELAKLEHIWDEGVETEATCTEPSFKKYECTLCHEVKYDSEPVSPALGHSWNEGEILDEPVADKPGSTKYTCQRCGEEKIETTYFVSDVVEDGVVYVRNISSDTPNGSRKYPYTDIQSAIDSLEKGEVRIEEGTYDINATLKMKPGVSLVGSYVVEHDGAIWKAAEDVTPVDRGATSAVTTYIVDKAIAAGTSEEFHAAILFSGADIGPDTCIKNIAVGFDDLSRTFVAAVDIKDSASPVIDSSILKGGKASDISCGLHISGASADLKNTVVESGEASTSVAVFNAAGRNLKLEHVTVDTANADNKSIGVYNYYSSSISIVDSSVMSKGLNSGGFFGSSYGIDNINSTMTISNSEIKAGGGGPTSNFGITIGTRAINDTRSTTIITDSDIRCLDSNFAGSGAAYYNDGSVVMIANSRLSNSNNSSVSYTVWSTNGDIALLGNVIEAGICDRSGGDTFGVYISSGKSMIMNNTIVNNNPGGSYSAYGIYMNSGLVALANNLMTSKAHTCAGFGFYSNSVVPEIVKNNAFFDLNTALYAPQGKTGVYYVTAPDDFDEVRTKLPAEKLSGNVGEKVGSDDPDWSNNTVFKNFDDGDYSLKATTNSSIREGGLIVDLELMNSILSDKAFRIPAEILIDNLSVDRNGKERKNVWSIGAYQY